MKKIPFSSYALIFFWPLWLLLGGVAIRWLQGMGWFGLIAVVVIGVPLIGLALFIVYKSYMIWRSRSSSLGAWLTVYLTWLLMIGVPLAWFFWNLGQGLCARLSGGEHGTGPRPLPGACIPDSLKWVWTMELKFHLLLVVAMSISALLYWWRSAQAEQKET